MRGQTSSLTQTGGIGGQLRLQLGSSNKNRSKPYSYKKPHFWDLAEKVHDCTCVYACLHVHMHNACAYKCVHVCMCGERICIH